MLTIKSKLDIKKNLTTIIDPKNLLMLDIETTGLSSKYNQIYIIGLAYIDDAIGAWVIEQIFAESHEDEPLLLAQLSEKLSDETVVVTYNGDTFDLPFIKARMIKHGIKVPDFISEDILRYLKKNMNFLEFENYKLKTIEKKLGVIREDIYSGKDCIDFYIEYTRTKSEKLKNIVLKHNYDDLLAMPHLLKVYTMVDNKRTILLGKNDIRKRFYIEDIQEKGDLLIIEGNVHPPLSLPIRHYQTSTSINISENGAFQISYELIKAIGENNINVSVIDSNNIGLPAIKADEQGLNVPRGFILVKKDKLFLTDNIKLIASRHLEMVID